jgi:hypothetical protein
VDYKKFGLRYKELLAELRATPDFDEFRIMTLSLDMELDRLGRIEPYDFSRSSEILILKQQLVNLLIKKFKLPPPFRIILGNPFNPDANGLFFAPYRIDPQVIHVKKGEFEHPRIAGEPLDELTVTIYGRLSTEDWRTLKERIERLQDIAFDSDAIRPFRRSKNINEKVRVIKEMATRKPKRTREEIVQGSYIDHVMKSKKGKLSVSEKRTLIKLNPESVEKIIDGKTSADVAIQLNRHSKAKDKGAAVRKTLSRFKNAQKLAKRP